MAGIAADADVASAADVATLGCWWMLCWLTQQRRLSRWCCAMLWPRNNKNVSRHATFIAECFRISQLNPTNLSGRSKSGRSKGWRCHIVIVWNASENNILSIEWKKFSSCSSFCLLGSNEATRNECICRQQKRVLPGISIGMCLRKLPWDICGRSVRTLRCEMVKSTDRQADRRTFACVLILLIDVLQHKCTGCIVHTCTYTHTHIIWFVMLRI